MHGFEIAGGEASLRGHQLHRFGGRVAERFADGGNQFGDVEQKFVLVGRTYFRSRDGVASPGVQSFHRQLVAVATATERASDDSSHPLTDRNQPSRLLVEFGSGLGKLAGKLARTAAAEGIDKACSFERDIEHGFQGIVEDRISGLISEVRYENADRGMSSLGLGCAN